MSHRVVGGKDLYCLAGAAYRVGGQQNVLNEVLLKAIGSRHSSIIAYNDAYGRTHAIIAYNDDSYRTHADVLKTVKKAIAIAEGTKV